MSAESDSEKSSISAASPSRESTPDPDSTFDSAKDAAEKDLPTGSHLLTDGDQTGKDSDEDEQKGYESDNDDVLEEDSKEKEDRSRSPMSRDNFSKDSDEDEQKGYESDNGDVLDEDSKEKDGIKEVDDEEREDEDNEKDGKEEQDEDENEKEDDAGQKSGNDEEGDETHDSEKPSPSKRHRVVMSSDDEEDDVAEALPKSRDEESDGEPEGDEVGVGELMTNIFGEESDEEGFAEGVQEGQEVSGDANGGLSRNVRGEVDDEEEDDGRLWDFDVMLQEKKAERKKTRRRRKDGSIYVGGDMDEQIKLMIDAMKVAAKDDRHCNMERKPALQKRKMLKVVKGLLIKHDYMEAIIDSGMMNAVSEWLAPLPDKSLPALEIRTELLRILQGYGRLEPGTLKQSGLGRAVMLLFKHPRETHENKRLAQNLLREWARPIFQLETDFSTMTKDERVQRDYAQQPEAKKRRLSSAEGQEKDSEPRPGDKDFIIRARVPRPSQKDYVVRPKSNIEGQFHGATKSRQNSRFDKAQREFRERNKQTKTTRAMKVSIEGRKMDI